MIMRLDLKLMKRFKSYRKFRQYSFFSINEENYKKLYSFLSWNRVKLDDWDDLGFFQRRHYQRVWKFTVRNFDQ